MQKKFKVPVFNLTAYNFSRRLDVRTMVYKNCLTIYVKRINLNLRKNQDIPLVLYILKKDITDSESDCYKDISRIRLVEILVIQCEF